MKSLLTISLIVVSINVMASGLDINSPQKDRIDAIVEFHKKFPLGTEVSKITSAIMDKKMGMDLVDSLCNSSDEYDLYRCYEYFSNVQQVDIKSCKPHTTIFTPANSKAREARKNGAFCMREKIAATIKKLPEVSVKSSSSPDCSGYVSTSSRQATKPSSVEEVLKQSHSADPK